MLIQLVHISVGFLPSLFPPSATYMDNSRYILPSSADALAATLVGLDFLRVERDTSFTSLSGSGSGLCFHARLDLRGHRQKGLFHILRRLGRGLQKLNAQAVCKLLALFRRYDTFGSQITLITHQQLIHILRCIPINFVQPLLDVVEGLHVRDVVYHNDTVGTAIVGRRDGAESFLSCRVPNLQFDSLLVQFDSADFLNRERGGIAIDERKHEFPLGNEAKT